MGEMADFELDIVMDNENGWLDYPRATVWKEERQMKIHTFEIFGGQTKTQHGNEWPDIVEIKIPRSQHADIIAFLAKTLSDPTSKYSKLKIVGELKTTGEKSQMELFGPVDNTGNEQ